METSLEKRLVDLYLANADIINEGLPLTLNHPRAEALEVFNLLGLPERGSARQDRYHYTDLRNLFKREYEHYFTPSYTHVTPQQTGVEGEHFMLFNGFSRGVEAMVRYKNGVIYGSLAAASMIYPELVERYYNRLAGVQADAISAINTVFAQDGAFLYVPKGVRAERPFVITASHYSEAETLSGFVRNLFIFEEGSEVQVLLDNRSQSDDTYLSCQVRELFVAANAQVDLIELVRMNEYSSLISNSFAEQYASSRLRSLSVALSGNLVRADQRVRLTGRDAENHTDGLLLCGAREHFDFTSDIEHIATDCTSYELVKGVAANGGTGVFCGRIHVAQDAQHTAAYQQNNNLLLGDEAHIYTKPQLEIYADNVKCSHGATVGQLSAEAIYYMRQRGISEETARRLQLAGFINQVVEKTPIEGATALIESLTAVKIDRM